MNTEANQKEKNCAWCGDAPRIPGKVCCRKTSCARKYGKFLERLKRVFAVYKHSDIESPPGFIYENKSGEMCFNIEAEPEKVFSTRQSLSDWITNPPPAFTPIMKAEISEKLLKEEPAISYLVLKAQGKSVLSKEAIEKITRRKNHVPEYDELSYVLECLFPGF